MYISIIISTCNRPQKLKSCLNSIGIAKLIYTKNTEVIVVDQSDNNQTQKIVKQTNYLIKYTRITKKNLSFARNIGIKHSKGKIIAFTDDDCLVDKNWLKNINQSFDKHKNIIALFGQVKAYQASSHKHLICPCTFERKKQKIISKACKHSTNIGFGNNMAFRKNAFCNFEGYNINGFKEWLGLGSIGMSAEDAEMPLRLLINKHQILYNPRVKVFHNRWITKEEFKSICFSYNCGETACYGYFAFQNQKFAKQIIKNIFSDSYRKLRKNLLLLKTTQFNIKTLSYNLQELFFRIRGLIVGFYFAIKKTI